MFEDDITFCMANCTNMECMRNKKHIRRPDLPHTYADFTGLSECKNNKEIEKEASDNE